MAKRQLQPLDITLRYGRAYQWVRRSFLAFSCALTFVLPLWHLHANDVEGGGIAGGNRWARVAQWLPSEAPGWLGAPTSVRLWVIELVDPLEAASVAVTRGVSWAWVWTVLPGVLLVALLGRFFCGWACPYLPILAASNAVRWLLSKFGFVMPDVKVPRVTARVAIVGVLGATAFFGAVFVPLIYPPAILGREVFRSVFYGSFGAGLFFVVGAFLFDTFVSRAGFCRSLCPGGAMFSVLSSLSPLRVTREKSKCTDCTVCDVVCNLGQKPMTDKLDEGCERCGKCIASCPTKALAWKISRPPLLRGPGDRP